MLFIHSVVYTLSFCNVLIMFVFNKVCIENTQTDVAMILQFDKRAFFTLYLFICHRRHRKLLEDP